MDYSNKGLPTSAHYRVDILYNKEAGRHTYWAVNKLTNLEEVPFFILSDATTVLQDLEQTYKLYGDTKKVVELSSVDKGVH